jgi:hypothetical protein
VEPGDLQEDLSFFTVRQKTHEELERHEQIQRAHREELNVDLLTMRPSDYKGSSTVRDLILNVADQFEDHSQGESGLKRKQQHTPDTDASTAQARKQQRTTPKNTVDKTAANSTKTTAKTRSTTRKQSSQ